MSSLDMRKTSIFLFIILLCLLGYALIYVVPNGHTLQILEGAEGISSLPFKPGEQFTYEVSYNGLKVGRSILTFNGEKDLSDKKAYHITFFTKIPSLKDTEEIYADRKTFLPIEVRRTIRKNIGFNDNIVERYDQDSFKVEISSKSSLRSKSFSIEKDSAVHNAILLVYFYRAKEGFSQGEKMKVNLPTADFEVMFAGIESVKTPIGEYRAYAFTSDPPKFKFWLSADEQRIPLKIKNPGTLGYSLVIKSID